MRRFSRVLALVAMALGLVATSVPAAHAASVLNVTFAGQAELGCAGLGYPIPPTSIPPTPETGPKCGFVIAANVCVAEEVSAKKIPPVLPGLCTILAEGLVTGYCGLSLGFGEAKIDFGPQTFKITFKFDGVGGTLILLGTILKITTGQTGEFKAVVEALPPTPLLTPEGGSCLSNNATVFQIAGDGVGVMV